MKLSDITDLKKDLKTIQNRQDVKQWMTVNTVNDFVRYNINDDLSVSVLTAWSIAGNSTNSPVLPVKIASINGGFKFAGQYSYRLTSLQNFPSSISGNLVLEYHNITSFHNIHKIIKNIRGYIELDETPVVTDLLGVLLIKGLRGFYVHNVEIGKQMTEYEPFLKAAQIIHNYVYNNSHDINACQEEMIDAGLEEFARL